LISRIPASPPSPTPRLPWACDYGHPTAGEVGRIAAGSGARLLALTHFSQRYERCGDQQLAGQAASAIGEPVLLAHDLDRIPMPSRHPSAT
jgi:ribonuclease Z